MKRKADIIKRDGRISIEANIQIEKRIPVKDKEKAKILVYGSIVDWEKLCYCFDMRDREGLRRMAMIIFKNIIEPVKNEISNNNRKVRGVHASRKGESEFVYKLRRYAACMSVYLSHYMLIPKKDWPADLKYMINDAKRFAIKIEEIRDNRLSSDKLHPLKITYLLWKNEFNKPLRDMHMSGPKNFNNFKKVYIHKNEMIKLASHFLSRASDFQHLLNYLP
jgi:hypothetical protein